MWQLHFTYLLNLYHITTWYPLIPSCPLSEYRNWIFRVPYFIGSTQNFLPILDRLFLPLRDLVFWFGFFCLYFTNSLFRKTKITSLPSSTYRLLFCSSSFSSFFPHSYSVLSNDSYLVLPETFVKIHHRWPGRGFPCLSPIDLPRIVLLPCYLESDTLCDSF